MATLSRGITYGASEIITNTKLHNLVDLGSVSQIVDADISSSANITDSKLADITTTNKVKGTALSNLASIPSGAGIIPVANLGSIPNTTLSPITLTSWVDGAAMRNIQSMPSLAGQLSWYSVVSSMASGSIPFYNGGNTFIGTPFSRTQLFTSSGTFTAPAGITRVFITAVGAGGGGGGGTATNKGGGGGGGGQQIINYPYTVVPGNNYTVTINAGGTGGAAGNPGNNGGTTVFDALTITGGKGGAAGTTGTGGLGGDPTTIGLLGGSGETGGSNLGANGGSTIFGAGATKASNAVPSNALANTGGGGASAETGDATNRAGSNGGTGIVVISY